MALRIPPSGLYFLSVITVVMVLIQVWLSGVLGQEGGVSTESAVYYRLLALSWRGVTQMRLWQFVTHALTHASWYHLTVNLLVLWFVWGRVIGVLGGKCFALIVVLGALAGGGLHVLVDYLSVCNGHQGTQLVGFSGACFALILVLTRLSPNARVWPIPVSGKNLGLGLIFAELLLLFMTPELGVPVLSFLGGWMVEHVGAGLFVVSHACHLGGGLVGWFLASALKRRGRACGGMGINNKPRG